MAWRADARSRKRKRQRRSFAGAPVSGATFARRSFAWAAASSAVILGLIAALALLSAEPDAAEVDYAAETADLLARRGHNEQVINCVVRLGERQLTVAPLSEAALEEITESCDETDRILAFAQSEPAAEPELAPDVPSVHGDDATLDRLWDSCAAGAGIDCDALFEQAPPGTDYERFGLTCGERPSVLYCSDLVLPEDEAELG